MYFYHNLWFNINKKSVALTINESKAAVKPSGIFNEEELFNEEAV